MKIHGRNMIFIPTEIQMMSNEQSKKKKKIIVK